MKTSLLSALLSMSLGLFAQNGTIHCSFSDCVGADMSKFTITHNGFVLGHTDQSGVFAVREKIEGEVIISHPLCKPYRLSSITRGRKSGDFCSLELRAGVADSLTTEMMYPVDFTSVADSVDVQAEFPGGTEELSRHLVAHIRYPGKAVEEGIYGKVYLSLLIDAQGNVKGVQIDKGVIHCLDMEAYRVAKTFPQFKPAIKNGVAVASRYRLPIKFQLMY